MKSLTISKCDVLKVESDMEKLSSSTIKRKKSLSRRKSLKILKDSRIKLQNSTAHARNAYIGDRIIVHRGVMDFSQSEDILMCRVNRENMEIVDDLSVPTLIEKTMLPGNGKLLKLTSKHKSPSHDRKLKALYEKNKLGSTNKCSRYISMYPERILDAPMLSTECWNILDWNSKGVLAVALGSGVYLWHSSGGNVEELAKNNNEDDFGCIKWLHGYDDNILAVGSIDGKLSLWKDSKLYCIINTGIASKISALACKKTLLYIAFESGLIQNFDLQSKKVLFSIYHHKKAIYQMKWSSNFSYLAVASQDGSVSVWSANNLDSVPIANFVENNSGMYDVAWSPSEDSHLLFAGGEGNKVLKIMDVKSRTCVRSLNVHCRMSLVFWDKSFREIVVSAYDENGNCCLRLYNDCTLKMLTEMSGHKGDIISLIANPVTGILATVGRDESIRLWNCFKADNVKKPRSSDHMSTLTGFGRLR